MNTKQYFVKLLNGYYEINFVKILNKNISYKKEKFMDKLMN